MRKFVVKCGLAFFIAVAIFIILESLARKVPNDYSMKNSYLTECAPHIKTLVLGNSQAYFGVNPAFFDKPAFNIAHVSQPLNMDKYLLDRFCPQMDSLRNIILCISYFTPFVFWEVDGGGEAWRIKHYHLYYDYPVDIYDIADNIELYNLNLNHNIRWFKAIRGKSLVYTDSVGFGHNYLKFHAPHWEDCRAIVKGQTFPNFSSHKYVAVNRKIIDDIAKSNKNKRIILFIPPVWNSYRKQIDVNQLNYVVNFCKELENDNSNVTYTNLFADARFVADDFADAYHLAEAGAKKLTLILNQMIENEE